MDESVVLAPDAALREAQRLLDAGFPFHAHEVLEGAWKAAPDPERDLWQGLAQLAVGLTHDQRGNARGAAALLHRGASRLDPATPPAPHGIDAAGLAAWGHARADAAAAGEPVGPPPRLVAGDPEEAAGGAPEDDAGAARTGGPAGGGGGPTGA